MERDRMSWPLLFWHASFAQPIKFQNLDIIQNDVVLNKESPGYFSSYKFQILPWENGRQRLVNFREGISPLFMHPKEIESYPNEADGLPYWLLFISGM